MPMEKGAFVADGEWIYFQHEGKSPIKLFRAADAIHAQRGAALLQRHSKLLEAAEKLVKDLQAQLQKRSN